MVIGENKSFALKDKLHENMLLIERPVAGYGIAFCFNIAFCNSSKLDHLNLSLPLFAMHSRG